MSSYSVKNVTAVSFVVGLVLAASCAHQKPAIAPVPTPAAAAAPTPAAGAGTAVVQPEPTIAPAGNPEGGVASSELPANLEELNKAGYLKDAFFDTDKAELRPDARDALATDAEWLKQHPTVKLQIEGHCDERNTEAYNLALGWRRCNATKDYLVSLGVAAERFATISYGKERPFASCHDESCWSQNRRSHFLITAR
ncbi:MAG: peptidoglycan-associated lipoprotein Pal [Thermoanaerobaculales bacterium]